MLEILVVPACFVAAGLVGSRLGTPARVARGLVALGCCHLLAFLGGYQALTADGVGVAWVHLASQVLVLDGFVALVWLAATYPDQRTSTPLLTVGRGAECGRSGARRRVRSDTRHPR